MAAASCSEQVIRRLYQITNHYQLGFEHQIHELLAMGLERFNLDIAIFSQIEGERYRVKQCIAPDAVELTPGDTFDFAITYCHLTCQAQGPVAIENMGKSDELASHPAYQAFGLESYIGIPIRPNGKLYGTLNFSSPLPYPRHFQEHDVDALQLMASWIEVELIRREQEQQLKELNEKLEVQACFDSLTQVPNRRGMFRHVLEEINRLSRIQGKGSLSLIDIDHFKRVNDTYGHQVGDEVLVEVAKSIEGSLRSYDFVARVGGEEFMLWLPNSDVDGSTDACRRIMEEIAKIETLKETLTVSIGVCNFSCHDCTPEESTRLLDDLFAKADKALYQAKEAGRNRVIHYQEAQQIPVKTQLAPQE